MTAQHLSFFCFLLKQHNTPQHIYNTNTTQHNQGIELPSMATLSQEEEQKIVDEMKQGLEDETAEQDEVHFVFLIVLFILAHKRALLIVVFLIVFVFFTD